MDALEVSAAAAADLARQGLLDGEIALSYVLWPSEAVEAASEAVAAEGGPRREHSASTKARALVGRCRLDVGGGCPPGRSAEADAGHVGSEAATRRRARRSGRSEQVTLRASRRRLWPNLVRQSFASSTRKRRISADEHGQ